MDFLLYHRTWALDFYRIEDICEWVPSYFITYLILLYHWRYILLQIRLIPCKATIVFETWRLVRTFPGIFCPIVKKISDSLDNVEWRKKLEDLPIKSGDKLRLSDATRKNSLLSSYTRIFPNFTDLFSFSSLPSPGFPKLHSANRTDFPISMDELGFSAYCCGAWGALKKWVSTVRLYSKSVDDKPKTVYSQMSSELNKLIDQ